jgi:hypothetical protein
MPGRSGCPISSMKTARHGQAVRLSEQKAGSGTQIRASSFATSTCPAPGGGWPSAPTASGWRSPGKTNSTFRLGNRAVPSSSGASGGRGGRVRPRGAGLGQRGLHLLPAARPARRGRPGRGRAGHRGGVARRGTSSGAGHWRGQFCGRHGRAAAGTTPGWPGAYGANRPRVNCPRLYTILYTAPEKVPSPGGRPGTQPCGNQGAPFISPRDDARATGVRRRTKGTWSCRTA